MNITTRRVYSSSTNGSTAGNATVQIPFQTILKGIAMNLIMGTTTHNENGYSAVCLQDPGSGLGSTTGQIYSDILAILRIRSTLVTSGIAYGVSNMYFPLDFRLAPNQSLYVRTVSGLSSSIEAEIVLIYQF